MSIVNCQLLIVVHEDCEVFLALLDVGDDDVDGVLLRNVVHIDYKVVIAGVVTRHACILHHIHVALHRDAVDDVDCLVARDSLAGHQFGDAFFVRGADEDVDVVGVVPENIKRALPRHNAGFVAGDTVEDFLLLVGECDAGFRLFAGIWRT